jgi:endonuclease YncB( thermonuclease family)
MFHTLRKIVFLILFGLLACFGAYVYHKRAIFNPLVDLVEVWQIHRKNPTRMVGQLTGQVTKVGDELGFHVKSEQGPTYSLRLAGLEPPGDQSEKPKKAKDPIEVEARTILNRLILSNHVRVDLTFMSEQRSGLGIAYRGETNINAAIAEAGLAKVKREYLKGLPWKEQYKLVRAERKAQEKQSGLWSSDLAAETNSAPTLH